MAAEEFDLGLGGINEDTPTPSSSRGPVTPIKERSDARADSAAAAWDAGGTGRGRGKGGKGKGKAGKGGKGKTGKMDEKKAKKSDPKKYCAPCGRLLPLTMFSAHTPVCHRHEAVLKRATRLCKAQGKLEWLAQVKKSPERYKRFLDYYEEKCAPNDHGKYPILDINQFIEFEKAITFTEGRQIGIFMHKSRAFKHWQSVEGGGKEYPDCEKAWADAIKASDNGEVPEPDDDGA